MTEPEQTVEDEAGVSRIVRVRNVTSHPEPLPGGYVLAPLAYAEVDANDPRISQLLEAVWLVEVTEGEEAGTSTEDPEVTPAQHDELEEPVVDDDSVEPEPQPRPRSRKPKKETSS